MPAPSDPPAWRACLAVPIPEAELAAGLLEQAADALLAGNLQLARDRVRRADIPVLRAFALDVMGGQQPAIPRQRRIAAAVAADRMPQRMPGAAETAMVLARDGWHCRFCGVRVIEPRARDVMREVLPGAIPWDGQDRTRHAAFLALTATIDHIVPHSLGGRTTPDNLVAACWPCNFGRGDGRLEEVGLTDPRNRAPAANGWDGLQRLGRLRPPARAAGADGSAAAWFAAFDRDHPTHGPRLRALLDEAAIGGVTWRARKVAVLRVPAPDGLVLPLGIEPDGDVYLPWMIGPHKAKIRPFAIAVAAAVPDAIVYETPKLWAARSAHGRPLQVAELLEAAPAVLAAVARLHDALTQPAAPA